MNRVFLWSTVALAFSCWFPAVGCSAGEPPADEALESISQPQMPADGLLPRGRLMTGATAVGPLARQPKPLLQQCMDNSDCQSGFFCQKKQGACGALGACEAKPTLCTNDYSPVRGCDGQEYGNPCSAAHAGSSVELPRYWPNDLSRAISDPWIAEHHSDLRVMRPRAIVLDFLNLKPLADVEQYYADHIAARREASRYHAYDDPNASAFIEYEIAYLVDMRDSTAEDPNMASWNLSSLTPIEDPKEGYWLYDYEKLFTHEYAQHYGIVDPDDSSRVMTLCEMIERGFVHEIWLHGMHGAGAAEVLELKPKYDENRVKTGAMDRCAGNGCFDQEDLDGMMAEDSYCANLLRTIRVDHMNGTRGIGCPIHGDGHGWESLGRRNTIPYLTDYFPAFANLDLNTKHPELSVSSWYGCNMSCTSPQPGEECVTYGTQNPSYTLYDYDQQQCSVRQSGALTNYDPVCGNVHFPPNARSHYDDDNTQPVSTSCTHFRDGTGLHEIFNHDSFAAYNHYPVGNRTLQLEDCEGGFMVWWYQNFPGLDNKSIDDDGLPMLNWWPFLLY